MRALLKGEEVYLPIFDFKSGKRKYESKPKKLGSQDILVIEGIHCLNPKLTETMADANKFKIYISALTQLNIDEHNRIPTTDGRLIIQIRFDPFSRLLYSSHAHDVAQIESLMGKGLSLTEAITHLMKIKGQL